MDRALSEKLYVSGDAWRLPWTPSISVLPEMRRSFLLTSSPTHRRSVITQAFGALLACVLLTMAPSVGATLASAMPQPTEPPPRFDSTTRHSLCHEGRCVVLDGTGRQLAEHRGMQYLRPFKNGVAVFERGGTGAS